MVQLCLLCAWLVFGGIFWTPGVCVCYAGLGAKTCWSIFNVCLLHFCI